jgi:hypothetical protein
MVIFPLPYLDDRTIVTRFTEFFGLILDTKNNSYIHCMQLKVAERAVNIGIKVFQKFVTTIKFTIISLKKLLDTNEEKTM